MSLMKRNYQVLEFDGQVEGNVTKNRNAIGCSSEEIGDTAMVVIDRFNSCSCVNVQ